MKQPDGFKGFGTTKAARASLLISSLLAGLGGCLPTLCKLAATTSADPRVEVFSIGHASAMLLYFVISLVLCLGIQERRPREAFLLGIAAPALITNYLGGLSAPAGNGREAAAAASLLYLLPISNALAAEPGSPGTADSRFWQDFMRGLGFADRDLERQRARKPFQIDETYRTFSKLTPVAQKDVLRNLGSIYASLDQHCEAKLHYDLAEQLANSTSDKSSDPRIAGTWSISEWIEPRRLGSLSQRFVGASGFLTLRPTEKPGAFAGELHMCAKFATGTRPVRESVTAAFDGKNLSLDGKIIDGRGYWSNDRLRLKLQGLKLEGTSMDGGGERMRFEKLL